MKNTFGQSVALTLFGESHGAYIGAVLDGLAPGIAVNEQFIAQRLKRRRPSGAISTGRAEEDPFEIVSGVFGGKTTGTPLCIVIPNKAQRSADYEKDEGKARPGHADYTAYIKYHGFQDGRGGGHFSGRITAALVAAGAVCESALHLCGVRVGTHVLRCAGVQDIPFSGSGEELDILDREEFPTLSSKAREDMKEAILAALKDRDSVGGVLETEVLGLPAGVGEPWFDSLEGMLSHAVFSVPAVKGIQFGAGFALSEMRGSAANDSFYSENGRIYTKTNNNGGINGGISNGMPIVFSCAVKPTPSIGKAQQTVNFYTGEEQILEIVGRHDPAIVHRACPVVSAVTALTVCDALALRYGTDFPFCNLKGGRNL